MKPSFVSLVLLISLFTFTMPRSAFAAYGSETCFQLTPIQDNWRSPDEFCLAGDDQANSYLFVMKTGPPNGQSVVATFNLNKVSEGRAYDKNQTEYAVLVPTTSVFNVFSIRFAGARDTATKMEKGSVLIGSTKLYYRSKPPILTENLTR